MRAVVLDYDSRTLRAREIPQPRIETDSQVLLRVREVGVCGTDRELAAFRFGFPPPGDRRLVLGHEALAQVIATGPAVKKFRPGDWVVPMIRRACDPLCASCARGRRDLCISPGMRERGIFGLHGYWSELAVDEEVDLVLVPASLADRAVLMEPLSVVEKAVEAALRVHEPGAASALVFGAGPIGTLAAFVLRLRGLSVSVHSLEAPSHPRAALLASAGIEYLAALGDASADIVIEAAGSPTACVQAVNCLAPLGVCVILGAPDSTGDFPFRSLITGNRTVLGSVNASPHSFALAARDLELFPREIIAGMIDRFDFARFDQTILAPQASRPKLVHVISD